jgi:hypothetical protein
MVSRNALLSLLFFSFSLCHATISKNDLRWAASQYHFSDIYYQLQDEAVQDLVQGDEQLLKEIAKQAIVYRTIFKTFDDRPPQLDTFLELIKPLVSPLTFQEITDFHLASVLREEDYEENLDGIWQELTNARKGNDAPLALRIIQQNNLQPPGGLHQVIYKAIKDDQLEFVDAMIPDDYLINDVPYRLIHGCKRRGEVSPEMRDLLIKKLRHPCKDSHPNF